MSDGPTHPSQRFELIDALRGFALFGVLLVNLEGFTLYEFLPPDGPQALAMTSLDHWVDGFIGIFVSGTSITLFSLLFGVGFSLQMRRGESDPRAARRYLRRLAVLLVIGLLHASLWWGDILRYYAVMGALLLPLQRLRVRTIACAGVLLVLVAPLLLQPWLSPLLARQSNVDSAARSLASFSGSDWSEMLQANFQRTLHMLVGVWILPTYVLGRLMIGAALGRSGKLQEAPQQLPFWRRFLVLMLVLSTVAQLGPMLVPTMAPWLDGQLAKRLMFVLRQAQPLCLGLTYMAGFVLLYQRPGIRRRLAWLAPIGRMALTNYLSQTVIAMALFYGVGLGLGPIAPARILATAILIFAAQAVISRWWLARYRQGPVEWVWRRLTYGGIRGSRWHGKAAGSVCPAPPESAPDR